MAVYCENVGTVLRPILLLTTFRKRRTNERGGIERARKQAVADAASNP